jgi:hypothetical protein
VLAKASWVRLRSAVCCPHRRPRMEHLWSRAVATGGDPWQMQTPEQRRKQAETVAVDCDRLPIGAHGKERVCHRLPLVAEVPLSGKEGVDFLAPQNAKSCEPEGPQDLTARL